MKWTLTLVLAITMLAANGQRYGRFLQETSALMTDAMGQPFYPQQKYNWEGKVFFPDEYTLATVTTPNGKVYQNIRAKLNLLDNTLLFTDSADREFVATAPIAKVEFEEIPAQKKTTFIRPAGDTGKALYLVLDSGKATLLKKIFLTYTDQTNFGSTTVTRIFEQKYSYYSLVNETINHLDRTKSAVLKVLGDKRNKVEAYIEVEKLKFRKEEDLVKVFAFYNNF